MYALPCAAVAALALASCTAPMNGDAPPTAVAAPPAPTAAATAGVNGFGFRLFERVRAEAGERNVFLAPASVALALAMTHEGAAGETREAIARVLGTDPDGVRGAAAALLDAAGDGEDVRLRVANSLWAREGVPILPAFLQRTRSAFGAEATTLDFGDPGAAARINRWVDTQTEGRIPSIVDRIDPDEVLFLVNAVYFQGRWTQRFDPRATAPGDFTLPGGERVAHPMMNHTGEFASLEGDGWKAVHLPYGDDRRIGMYLFVPDQGRTLADFYAQLTPEGWDGWMERFRPGRLAVTIPRFRMQFERALHPHLAALGMEVAFDAERADFGGMFPREFLDRNNARITRVQHRAFVEVDEQGTTAAGATSVAIGIVSMPPQFAADRPFFFAIRDNRTGAVLFTGQVTDPRQE